MSTSRKRVRFLRNILAVLLLFLLSFQNAESASVPKTSRRVKADVPRKSAMDNIFCHVVVTAFHYNINIDPVVLLEDKDGYNATQQPPAETFALAKIKMRVIERKSCNESSAGTGSIITIKPRGCAINGDSLEITDLGSGDQLTVSDQSIFSKENHSGEICSTEKCQIILNEKLVPGDELELSNLYTFNLIREYTEEKWQGFYYYNPKHFKSGNDKDDNYPLHTQFIFPTFDNDPIEKATFELSVSRRKAETEGCVAISNGDLLETADYPSINTWLKNKFMETPPLPLDQITVMLLCGFQKHTVYDTNTSNNSTNGTQINVWSFNQENNTELENDDALVRHARINGTADKALQFFQFYNGLFNKTAYPQGKIDFIAVPWGAHLCWTTNFGLVANNEDMLLISESSGESSSAPTLLNTPMNSEIAFQWIGGMITSPNSLDDQNAKALLDYVATWTREKNNFMTSASMCENNGRGKAQLEMLESVLSRQVMQSAVADILLPKLQWKTALPADFQDAIQQSVEAQNITNLLPLTSDGKSVSIKEIFTSWQKNIKFEPQIHVSSKEGSSAVVLLSQVDPSGEISHEQFWWVPVKILGEYATDLVWLSPNTSETRNETIEWQNAGEKWFILNPDGKGYYNVKYDEIVLQQIVSQLEKDHTALPEAGRTYLITNQFQLPKSTKPDDQWARMRGALELTKYLGNELSVDVWTAVFDQITSLRSKFIMKGDKEFNSFLKYFSFMMNSALEKAGLDPNVNTAVENATGVDQKTGVGRENDISLPTKLMENCASFELTSCKTLAGELMAKWIEDPEIDPFLSGHYSLEIRNQLYCSAVQSENDKEDEHQIFDFLLDQLVTNENSEIAEALACSNKMNLLTALLNDTRLASGSMQIQNIYRDAIPYRILVNWPHQMTREVYNFWMRDLLAGGTIPAAFIRYMWTLVPGAYTPPGFVDEIVKFLEDHIDLFTNAGFAEHIPDFKDSIRDYGFEYNDNFWNTVGNKMATWFVENSP